MPPKAADNKNRGPLPQAAGEREVPCIRCARALVNDPSAFCLSQVDKPSVKRYVRCSSGRVCEPMPDVPRLTEAARSLLCAAHAYDIDQTKTIEVYHRAGHEWTLRFQEVQRNLANNDQQPSKSYVQSEKIVAHLEELVDVGNEIRASIDQLSNNMQSNMQPLAQLARLFVSSDGQSTGLLNALLEPRQHTSEPVPGGFFGADVSVRPSQGGSQRGLAHESILVPDSDETLTPTRDRSRLNSNSSPTPSDLGGSYY